jgi:hypothetical protein
VPPRSTCLGDSSSPLLSLFVTFLSLHFWERLSLGSGGKFYVKSKSIQVVLIDDEYW